jgi:hypothetical protein
LFGQPLINLGSPRRSGRYKNPRSLRAASKNPSGYAIAHAFCNGKSCATDAAAHIKHLLSGCEIHTVFDVAAQILNFLLFVQEIQKINKVCG